MPKKPFWVQEENDPLRINPSAVNRGAKGVGRELEGVVGAALGTPPA